MIVFPLIRSVGLKAATASSRVETLPMFVRSGPSRTRRIISLSYGAALQRAIGDRLNDEEAGMLAALLGKLYKSGHEDG